MHHSAIKLIARLPKEIPVNNTGVLIGEGVGGARAPPQKKKQNNNKKSGEKVFGQWGLSCKIREFC